MVDNTANKNENLSLMASFKDYGIISGDNPDYNTKPGYYIIGYSLSPGRINFNTTSVIGPLGEPGITVSLAYGKPTTGMDKMLSPVEEIEQLLQLTKQYPHQNDIYVQKLKFGPRLVTSKIVGGYKQLNNPLLHRVFDLYLIQYIKNEERVAGLSWLIGGISRAIKSEDPEKVLEFLDPDEKLDLKVQNGTIVVPRANICIPDLEKVLTKEFLESF